MYVSTYVYVYACLSVFYTIRNEQFFSAIVSKHGDCKQPDKFTLNDRSRERQTERYWRIKVFSGHSLVIYKDEIIAYQNTCGEKNHWDSNNKYRLCTHTVCRHRPVTSGLNSGKCAGIFWSFKITAARKSWQVVTFRNCTKFPFESYW